jgi:hypothetical protein
MKTHSLILAAVLVAGAAHAEDSARTPPVGAETRAWLELQRSGAQASEVARPQPGEIAERTYQRYVKSYDQPIPATFDREQFVNSGGSSR